MNVGFSSASKFTLCFLFYEITADARVHVLRAKVRMMQEELDQLSSEYYRKVKLHQHFSRFALTCWCVLSTRSNWSCDICVSVPQHPPSAVAGRLK